MRPTCRVIFTSLLFAGVAAAGANAQAKPKTHILRAGPSTIAFGRYDAPPPPVLRVGSGDIVDLTTMLTNSPTGLERMGLAANRVQPELRAIYDSVKDRGP